jgi:hypothetical protein
MPFPKSAETGAGIYTLPESEMQTGTATTPRTLTAALLKAAIEYFGLAKSLLTADGSYIARVDGVPAEVKAPPRKRVAMAALDVDFSAGSIQTKALEANGTFTASNYANMTDVEVRLIVTSTNGAVPDAWPAGTAILSGTFAADSVNHCFLTYLGNDEFTLVIAQPQA